ncbi:dephospho-CoA kinase [Methanoregula sp.]|jgi:dephospho-CoA kinase|uniref:dephospho-CoA kinase n=1 Tax=Methanoregula sp. TaxID=2052170 RepID=UPI0025F0981C|nr:dephospho-CoA kinase [Methanoregula sp.]
MKVIGVVGLPASGKGEFSKIAERLGIPVVVMGDVIRKAVKKAGLPPTDANLGATANRLRAERGMDAIANLCVDAIKEQSAPLVLVDGIRGDAEVQVFRKNFPDFHLIAIETSFLKRLERLCERKRSDDVGSAEGLRTRDERELGWGLANALKLADITINNDGSLDEFTARVTELIRSMERNA